MGAQAINMETTPLYAASNSCGVKSLWLGFISDCLFGDSWDSWHDRPISTTEQIAETTAALVESLVSTIK
jgi:purine-nucleoside phosphorylase